MPRSRSVVFAVVMTGVMMASVTGTTVAVALPDLVSDLDTSLVWAGWVLSIYQLVGLASLPAWGKASDSLGRKRVFLLGVVLFTAGSVLASIAPTIHVLIVARALQAFGGAGFMPSAAGIASDSYPESRARAIGLVSSLTPIGMLIGPSLGGIIVQAFGWRSAFWMPIPLALIVFVAGLALLPGEAKPKGVKLDPMASILLGGGLIMAMLALSQFGEKDSGGALTMVPVYAAAGLTSFVLFFRREGRVAEPIIAPSLLREKRFLAFNAFNFLFGASMGISSLIPLYAVTVYGMSTVGSGLVMTPKAAATIFAATVTSFLMGRWGYRRPMVVGAVALSLAFMALAAQLQQVRLLGVELSGSALLFAIMFLAGLASGISNPTSNNAGIEMMPHRVGSIVGLRGMFRKIGGVFIISIGTLVLHLAGYSRGFAIIFLAIALSLLALIPLTLVATRASQPARNLEAAPLAGERAVSTRK
ncbi:MAG: MFS transporter [Chloroflexi bacterium]|nr:MFS transporter [Chloroflexota bacterium]